MYNKKKIWKNSYTRLQTCSPHIYASFGTTSRTRIMNQFGRKRLFKSFSKIFCCTKAVGCQKFVQYIRLLCHGRFILVESVFFSFINLYLSDKNFATVIFSAQLFLLFVEKTSYYFSCFTFLPCWEENRTYILEIFWKKL